MRAHWLAKDVRQRRRWGRLVVVLVVALLAYPVLGTLALWTGFVEWALRSEDLAVDIDSPAYTLWPGRVHVRRVMVMVNGETQFTLEGQGVFADVGLLPLAQRRFHVSKLRAHDVRYRMRVQVESEAGIEERLAAYPPLPELPGANVITEHQAADTEERESDYTVEIDGIEVRVVELWFMEYRYLGDGTLRGGFLLGPGRLRVSSSVQDLGPGQLRFGPDRVVANNFGGRVTASIPELDPNQHADQSFLDFVTGRVELNGDVESLEHLGAYVDGVTVRAGKGRFEANFGLERGYLGTPSHMRYQTDSVGVITPGVGIESDLRLDVALAAPQRDARGEEVPRARGEEDLPRVHASARSTYLSFSKGRQHVFTIQMHGHAHEAVLKRSQIGSGLSLKRARVEFPTIVSTDLDDLGAVFFEDQPLRVERGEARGSLRLDIDDDYVARGPLEARMDNARLRIAGIDVGASAQTRAAASIDLSQRSAALEDLEIGLADVSLHVGNEDVEDWWANLESERAFFASGPPRRYETTLALRAKDAEPLLEALAEKEALSEIIPNLAKLRDLRVTATVRGEGDERDVTLRSLESRVWDVAGRIWTKGDQSRVAIVFGGEAVSIGIASDGGGVEIMPFARTPWLNERLREFPAPIERIRPSKP